MSRVFFEYKYVPANGRRTFLTTLGLLVDGFPEKPEKRIRKK